MYNFHVQIEAKNGKLIPLPLHQQRRSTKRKWFVQFNILQFLTGIYAHRKPDGFFLYTVSFLWLLVLCSSKKEQILSQSGGWGVACTFGFSTFCIFYTENKEGWGRPLGPSPKFLEGTSMLHPLPTRNLPNLQDWPLYILSWDPKEMVWAHNFWSYSGSLKVSWGNSLEIWTGKYFWSMDFSPFPLNLSYPPAVST